MAERSILITGGTGGLGRAVTTAFVASGWRVVVPATGTATIDGAEVISNVDLVLPGFRYRAVMENGIVENELCPVYRASATGRPRPNPAEVDAVEWIDWHQFRSEVSTAVRDVSPWCRMQLDQLAALGPEPGDWPVVGDEALPVAGRP